MSKNYIIVGREVGEAKYYLHDDRSIDQNRGEDGKPLTVAHIGEIVVKMSELGEEKVNAAQRAQFASEIKHALQVIPQPSTELTPEQQETIWQNTTVELKWDKRETVNDTDENTRIIVIPADNTHTKNIEELSELPVGSGFHPPLTYPLDIALMLSGHIKTILDPIDSFALDDAALALSPEQRQALKDHMREELLGRYAVDPDEDRPEVLSKDAVLRQKIVSYYRAVGIYITLMCK